MSHKQNKKMNNTEYNFEIGAKSSKASNMAANPFSAIFTLQFSRLCENLRTVSSSFSMPVGIWGTARLIIVKSGKSGSSWAMKTAIGLAASKARARNDNFVVLILKSPGTAEPIKQFAGNLAQRRATRVLPHTY